MKISNEKILLHACCGPCSLEPVRLFQETGINPTIYYTNSNIQPCIEYERRLETLRKWASKGSIEDAELIEPVQVIEGAYDPKFWEETCGVIGDKAIKEAKNEFKETLESEFDSALDRKFDEVGNGGKQDIHNASSRDAENNTLHKPQNNNNNINNNNEENSQQSEQHLAPHIVAYREALAGGATFNTAITLAVDPQARQARCRACYRLRFEEVAKYAATHGFDAIGTTLSISPYQYTEIIKEELERAATAHNLKQVFQDYSPYYARATQKSRDIGMYRQNFCGCRISSLEAQAERAQRKYQRKQKKLARKKEREQQQNQ